MKISIPSSYVRAGENIKDGDIVKLLDEGEYKDIKGTDGKIKKVLQFQLELPNGEIKTYTMNITTQRELISAFGDDSKNWIGKPLKANIVKQVSFGKMTNVLILVPAGELSVKDKDIPVIEEDENPPDYPY